ncbi:MAG TPA: hypothetical protein VFC78_22360 [Tepidisphaeraceae bacterium]|nr:hypothetical protein [Tepidisphaeraceae bacterium]
MAKAKKQQSTDDDAPVGAAPDKAPRKPAAKAGKTKSAGGKSAQAAAPAPATPMIDTNLAASAAAKMLMHKDDLAAAHGDAGAPRPAESASFKHLKESLHKPGGQNTPSFLQSLTPNKKFNSSPNRHQQVGRNQTFGADVNRTGVPRRTGG